LEPVEHLGIENHQECVQNIETFVAQFAMPG
jgi:hypothetical protein